MGKVNFHIYYDGPVLESGRMDVRELAPALLAIGSLLEESNRVLNSDKATVSVKVKKFEDGSFGISFELIQTLTEQLVGLFSGDPVTAALNLLTLLGFVGVPTTGLYALLKKAKGRIAKKAKKLENGNIEIDFTDETIEVLPEVFDLYRDLKVRKEAENTIKPLEREGIEQFEVRYKGNLVESVGKKELPYFYTPKVEDHEIEEHETITTFSIHSLSFKEENKWRLSDGTNTFFVTISDQEFLRKVNENFISFSKGDLLKVKLKIKTWEVEDGLKTEYEVLEIIEHRSAARQLRLPFELD